MGFTYKIKITGNREVWASQITFKAYRDFVKALYSDDPESFSIHSNQIIESIVPGIIASGLNVIDKMLILLEARSISIDPDLKLTIRCTETDKSFEHVVAIDKIAQSFKSVDPYKTITHKEVTVHYSVVKAKDEKYLFNMSEEQRHINILASSIDEIVTPMRSASFETISFEDRVKLVSNFAVQFSNEISREIALSEKELSANKLLSVVSPYTGKTALEIPLTTDLVSYSQFIRLLFTEDLGNLYVLSFNLISKGYTGEYLDSLSYAEVQIYHSYIQQQAVKDQEPPPNNSGGNPFISDIVAPKPLKP
jgi:hypothetical protein